MSIFSSECVCALGESAVKNCSIHGGKPVTEVERIKEIEVEMLNNAKTAQLIIDGLEAKLEKAVEALRWLLNDTGGGDKLCGHEFTCVCAGDLARQTLRELGEAR